MAGFTGPPQAAAQDSLPAPVPGAAVTQSSHTTAQAEAGEPRADTSTQAPSNAPLAHDSAAPADSPPASRTQRGSAAVRASGAGQKPTAADRLELGTATVTGDREQPKVMYIVPWKKSDIGDLSGKPMNSLLDEALAPVDRDEFRREVVYYQAVKADASQNGASRSPAKQGEK
jgi:hypothetical protein